MIRQAPLPSAAPEAVPGKPIEWLPAGWRRAATSTHVAAGILALRSQRNSGGKD
jgi:hypothetical protein